MFMQPVIQPTQSLTKLIESLWENLDLTDEWYSIVRYMLFYYFWTSLNVGVNL